MLTRNGICSLAIALMTVSAGWAVQQPATARLMVRTCDGTEIFGDAAQESILVVAGDQQHQIAWSNLLSLHSAGPASELEQGRIGACLELLNGTDMAASEQAAAELTDIGLPVINPLLKNFPDTDAHEPDYRYRLFGRILPGHADGPDRSQGLVRMADGKAVRGNLANAEIRLVDSQGNPQTIPASNIRRIAVMRETVNRTVTLDALRHCSYVGYMDCGIVLTPESKVASDSRGFCRLSFDEDGWASDPDGIVDPLPGKRRLQEGFRWGSILGRVGPASERFYVGGHFEKSGLGNGRFYLVINDNEHWQNNIGSYRVQLVVHNAFDVGEPW